MSFCVFEAVELGFPYFWSTTSRHWVIVSRISRQHSRFEVRKQLPSDTASYFRRTETSDTPQLPRRVSHFKLQGATVNVTHFESRITRLLYTAINTTEHGQVSQCLGFAKSLASSIQRLGDVLHDNQDNTAISQVHLPRRDVECPA